MSYLQIQNLTKCWNSTVVVDDISFELKKHKFIALLGPSGCGKSTTLNMIAGLEELTSGAIYLNGENITDVPAGKRGVSMVFQSYALFPHLSVADNITFGLKARKVAKSERQQRLHDALELVNLTEVATKKPGQLSGGQRQRVALARAVVSQAPLCLMDEPLSNLDAKLRQSMRSEICSLQKRLGLSVLYVTHDQIEAMSMADEIILLNDGKIEQQGTPQELYHTPKSIFVAEFIGLPPMNILNTVNENILLGIRPEHISLCKNESPSAYSVVVLGTDYHGADTLLTVSLGEQQLILTVSGHHRCASGSNVFITWEAKNECYFNQSNRKRCIPFSRVPLFTNNITLGEQYA